RRSRSSACRPQAALEAEHRRHARSAAPATGGPFHRAQGDADESQQLGEGVEPRPVAPGDVLYPTANQTPARVATRPEFDLDRPPRSHGIAPVSACQRPALGEGDPSAPSPSPAQLDAPGPP